MRKVIIAAVLASSLVASSQVVAAPAPTTTKTSGVTVIGSDALAPAGTPDGAIAYVADQLGN